MFCPQCGQQQISGEVRFCSRCGFQLDGVTGLLASGGISPATVVQTTALQESPRRIGARLGGKLMLFGVFLIPALAIMSEVFGAPEELALLGVLFFLGGLLRMIYALIFEQGPYRQSKSQSQLVYAPPSQLTQTPRGVAELPAAQGSPVRSYVPPRHDTSEIAYRPSVTESTTRLLGDQDDEGRR